MSNHRLTAVVAASCGRGGASTGLGCPPAQIVLKTPNTMTMASVATNAYVGAVKMTPADLIPRMLTIVISASTARVSVNVCGSKGGTADTMAPTPAEMATAALRM